MAKERKANTGIQNWNREGFCKAIGSDSEHVFVLSRLDGAVRALDVHSGKKVWATPGLGLSGALLVCNGEVVTDKAEIDQGTGRIKHRFNDNGKLLGCVGNGLLWERSKGSLSFTTLDGSLRWEKALPSAHVVQTLSDSNGLLLAVYDGYPFQATSGFVVSLTDLGTTQWVVPIKASAPLPALPLSLDGAQLLVVVPVSEKECEIEEVARLTGQRRGASDPMESVSGPVVPFQGNLLFTGKDGKIQVIAKPVVIE